jgi:hypothetical protein
MLSKLFRKVILGIRGVAVISAIPFVLRSLGLVRLPSGMFEGLALMMAFGILTLIAEAFIRCCNELPESKDDLH